MSRFPDQSTEWHWKFRTLKAEVLLRKRSSQESLDLLGPNLPETLRSSETAVWQKLTEGSASAYLYEFADADRFLAAAKALASKYHPELLGEVSLRTGTLDFLRGDTPGAETAYRSALQIARDRQDSFLEAASLGSLGLIATQQEHYDESVDMNRAALGLSEAAGAQGSRTNILGNMAWGLFELGDYDRSLELFRQAQESAGKEGNLGAQLRWKIDVGALDFYVHDYAAAGAELRDALSLARKLDEPAQVAASLNALAAVAFGQAQFDTAEACNQEALSLFQKTDDHDGEISSTILEARIENARNDRTTAERLLKGVLDDRRAGVSGRWEAQARLATVFAGEGRPSDAEKEFRRAIATIQTARGSVRDEELRLSFFSKAIEFYDDYVEFLVAQHRTNDALRVAMSTHGQTLLEGLGLDVGKDQDISPDWESSAKRDRATILSYWLAPTHSYLWAIPSTGPARFFTLPSAEEINPLVRSYNEAVVGPRDPLKTANEDGERLYQMLVEPAISSLPKGSRVVIVPDGSLLALNFETLLVKSPQPHYWIEDVTVVNASSLLLATVRPPPAPPKGGKLLLIGDPVSASEEFPALPRAATEISDIQKYFSPHHTSVITGKDATPQAYMESRPSQFSYIHFVAHGTSSEATPLESAVILSKEGDSFKLYGRDIVKLPLSGALVTISACHGVGSRNFSGEGLVGLSWAFLRAGAQGVIAALWEVDDASTTILMDHFYGQLSKGSDPASALRHAKLALLQSSSVYEKPFYWAPFQYYSGK